MRSQLQETFHHSVSSNSSSGSKVGSTSSVTVRFFWETSHCRHRARFNLLLLDHNEYLLEDLSAYCFPVPSDATISSASAAIKDTLKIQGRLKLCSKSLVFEPTDVHYPVMKFPYKQMSSDVTQLSPKISSSSQQLSVELRGFFTFTSSAYFELKEGNKVGPYKMVEGSVSNSSISSTFRLVFALVHADVDQFMVKIEQLRHIVTLSQRQGSIVAYQLLKPFIEAAQLWTQRFDVSNLVNFHETLQRSGSVAALKIRPLTTHPGSLMVTDTRVYFQPSQLNNVGDATVLHFELTKVRRIFRRRYLLRQVGLEFLLIDGSSHLFVLDTTAIRNDLYTLLLSLQGLPSSVHTDVKTIESLTLKWQRREISNFEYLMSLNDEADRSVNDLTQYPVFPHVIADFTSKKLNLESPLTYRDLSKPIGALNPSRLQSYRDRFHSMPSANAALHIPPPFLYGTHYSTPGYVLYYLVRVAPEYMLCLQNGKFDSPDRLFFSIDSTWESCLNNPADIKELIPEFFIGSGDFLINVDNLDLGHRQTGERVNDVELPPWADSPKDFIRINSMALESEWVSAHLHEWIDLIFGYKQRGEAAVEADNVYYYLTYEGMVDLDTIEDARAKDALIMQIQEFGQTPKQLFTKPHPCRHIASIHDTKIPITSGLGIDSLSKGNVTKTTTTAKSLSNARKVNVLTSISDMESSLKQSETQEVKRHHNDTETVLTKLEFVGRDSSTVEVFEENLLNDGMIDGLSVSNSSSIMSSVFGNWKPFSSTSLSLPDQGQKNRKPMALNDTSEMNATVDQSCSVTSGLSMFYRGNPQGVSMVPSDAFYWHSKSVTGICVSASEIGTSSVQQTSSSTNRKRKTDACTSIIVSVSKDSNLKVVGSEQLVWGEMSSSSRLAAGVTQTVMTPRRTSSTSGSSLSSCCLLANKNHVIVASWDNHIYGYSIVRACSTGKVYAHDDAVTCLSLDKSNKWLLSGSLDTSVKLWSVVCMETADSVVSARPLAEFFHDCGVLCVAIDERGRLGASGTEDGVVTLFDLTAKSALFSFRPESIAGRAIKCMKWLPIGVEASAKVDCNSSFYKGIGGFEEDKLIYGTEDGKLICIDKRGKMFAATNVESSDGSFTAVCCVESDGRLLYGGCADGSMRCWVMASGAMAELCCHSNAHRGPVLCIAFSQSAQHISSIRNTATSSQSPHQPMFVADHHTAVIATAGDDCSVKLWRLYFEQYSE